MVSEKTLELANFYLRKHIVSDEEVGLGPFLDSGTFQLFCTRIPSLDGSITLQINEGKYLDCRTIAEGLYDDILQNNPELKPTIKTQAGRLQNWVEISDPETLETVKIDASPWYRKLNHDLTGADTSQARVTPKLEFTKITGPILSVNTSYKVPITVVLAGFLPQVSSEERLEKIQTAMKGSSQIESQAAYSFYLQASSGAGENRNCLVIGINLLEPAKLSLSGDLDFDTLIKEGIIEAGFHFSKLILYPSLNDMKRYVDIVGQSDLFAEIERNVPRLIKLFRQTTLTLDIVSDQQSRVNTKTGIINFYKSDPKFDEFFTRYARFDKRFEPPSISIGNKPVDLIKKKLT